MFSIGDIVGIYSPTAGYEKYHLCIKAVDDLSAGVFLLLNSDPNFAEVFVVDCARIPCLPLSNTGKSVFTFALIPRFNERQLALYSARKIGELDSLLAGELLEFARIVKTPTRAERQLAIDALTIISGR